MYLIAMTSDPLGYFVRPVARGDRTLDGSLFLVLPETVARNTGCGSKIVARARESRVGRLCLPRNQLLRGRRRQPSARKTCRAQGGPPTRILGSAGRFRTAARAIAVAFPPLLCRAASEILTTAAPGTDEPVGQYVTMIRWLAWVPILPFRCHRFKCR